MTFAVPSSIGLMRSLRAFGTGLTEPVKPEPSYPVLPARDEKGESSIPGVYLVGEVAGTKTVTQSGLVAA